MLLIVEIILTVKAWKNGWKGLALLPLGAAFGLGLVMGAGGVQPDIGTCLMIELPVLGSLIAMAAKSRKCVHKPVATHQVSSAHPRTVA